MTFDDDKKTTEDGRFRELSSGKLLVWGRERAGLTQEQIAKELYMTLSKVCALEVDDYRHVGADTFVRGYIRAYANLVKLDVAQVLAAYDRHAQKHGLREASVPRRIDSPNKPIWQFIALLLLVLFVLWLISIWFFDNRQKEVYARSAAIAPNIDTSVMQSSSLSSTIDANSFVVGVLTNATLSDDLIAAQVSVQSSSVANEASESSDSASSRIVLSAGRKVSIADALDEIELVFTEECWLEVSDSQGDVLIADLKLAGSRLQLQGVAPFDVKLGNAPAVKIKVNGNAVNFTPALGTNVASIKVGKVTIE